MADDLIRPIITSGSSDIFRPDPRVPVQGGNARVVKLVPIGCDGSTAPCIWRSRKTLQIGQEDGSRVPGSECLLLINKDPPTVMRAEVPDVAWQHFQDGLVEW